MNNEPGHRNALTALSIPSREQIEAFLDWLMADLRAQRDERLLPQMKALIGQDGSAHIDTDEQAISSGTTAENARSLMHQVDLRRRSTKGPVLEAGKVIDEYCNRVVAQLATLLTVIDSARLVYSNQKEAIERRRLLDEAAAAKVRVGETIETLGPFAPETDEAQMQAEIAWDAARATPSKLGAVGDMRGPRRRWAWKVIDFAAVPDAYKIIDNAEVKHAMRFKDRMGRPRMVIPGIEWVEERQLGRARS